MGKPHFGSNMKCNLTKLVRSMMLVVLTVVCINVFIFLNSRPGQLSLFNDGFLQSGRHHHGHKSHVVTTNAPVKLVSNVTCPGLVMMEPRPHGEFQTINGLDFHIYSAFLDDTEVKMIALVRGQESPAVSITCQMWYHLKGREPLFLYRAKIQNIPEDHFRKYTAAFVSCALPGHLRNETPLFVSLVSGDQCGQASNILTVNVPAKMTSEFTVCVTPLNYRYSRAYELVEAVEMSKLLGAQRIVFYNHSTGPNVDKVLEMYSLADEVEVHPWHLPMKTDTWPPTGNPEIHYFAQLAALNDCLYRHRSSSQYLVFQDLDEFIIPVTHDTWGELISSREKLTSVFVFKCVFFRKEWPKPAHEFEAAALKYKSVILTNTIREQLHLVYGIRSKFIVNPRKASMVGVHNVWTFVDTQDRVPESEASLHHYRNWERPHDQVMRVEDAAAAIKYGSRLVERLRGVWSKFEDVPMDINISTYGLYV